MTDSSAKLPNLWLLIAAAASILLITIGMRMTLGLFVLPVVNSTELSMTQFSLIIAVFQLMWGISQPLSGALADRFGAFKVLAGGTVLLIAACLMVPQMPTYWGLMLGIGLLLAFGTGSGGFSIIMGQVAAKTPPHRRGLASGLVNAGGSAGQFLFAPLVQGLIALPHVGWTGTFYVWAVIAILILPISWWLAGGKHAAHTVHTDDGQTLKQAVCKIGSRPSARLSPTAAISYCIWVSLPAVSTSPFWLPTCRPKFHFAASPLQSLRPPLPLLVWQTLPAVFFQAGVPADFWANTSSSVYMLRVSP